MTETVVSGLLIGVALIVAGIAIQRISRLAATGDLKTNAVAGIRTKATMASPEAWRAAHEQAERPSHMGASISLVAGVAAVAVSAATLADVFSESAGNLLVLIFAAIGTLGLLGFVGYGCVIGNRAAKEVLGGT